MLGGGGGGVGWSLLPHSTPPENQEKKTPFPYHYIFQYPLTNNMFRYLENKQLKNGGLNILRVPKTGNVCHVFDPGAHTGRVEAKDGNIIETRHLNIESKHQLKAHCAIIWPLLLSTFVREARVKLCERVEKMSLGPLWFFLGKFFFFRHGLETFCKKEKKPQIFFFFHPVWTGP